MLNSQMHRGILSPNTPNFFFIVPGPKLNAIDAASYKDGRTKLYLEGELRYHDINRTPHWTEFCISHQHNKPLDEFNFCDAGNDLDAQ